MLAIDALTVSYKDCKNIINNFNLHVDSGDILAMLGNSGSGKTTILKAIAGFGNIDKGNITLDGKLLDSIKLNYSIPPEHRNIGMVFQDYALFVHLNVKQNIAFGLNKYNKHYQEARIFELLKLINLPLIAKKYPHQLSGGEQQRVALARSLAPKPKLLLLDEPFSNLNTNDKTQLITEIRQILKQEGTTAIFVTHDKQEAAILADRTIYINNYEKSN